MTTSPIRVLLFHDGNFGACAKDERFSNVPTAFVYIGQKLTGSPGEYKSVLVTDINHLLLRFRVEGIDE